ncbi:hypothetical protein Tcan_03673 [Toxocara canis]|uniref:Uncharacterized protein n=1 Tax=Toxocara canis TaxID=6265 RepID=A0A0B2VXN0_TOXCA|nr:hypothetical protein Tcan_03673 [Toxocara canis]
MTNASANDSAMLFKKRQMSKSAAMEWHDLNMMNSLTYSPRPVNLGTLTPNEKSRIIKRERERRRLIRYLQVRQQSAENARIIREKIRAAKEREMIAIKNEIADAIVRRMNRERMVLSLTDSVDIQANSVSRKRKIMTTEDDERATKRHEQALEKLRKERQAKRVKIISTAERRRMAERIANLRSRSQIH